MQLVKTNNELRTQLNKLDTGCSIGLVPTMGALHEGHLFLIRRSLEDTDFTIVSIFVNPLQFGPNEDYDNYPRTLEIDCNVAAALGVDFVYAPSATEILGRSMRTFVDIKNMGDRLCGAARPGHFRGVCTIVAKLFNLISPDRAYFGQKDIQQFSIIKTMIRDLNFDIEPVMCPIVREKDGLALSSRNVYLAKKERQEATVLYQCLKEANEHFLAGERDAVSLIKHSVEKIETKETARIDYVEIVDEEMQPVSQIAKGDILAVAVYFGNTRLIDNVIMGQDLDV